MTNIIYSMSKKKPLRSMIVGMLTSLMFIAIVAFNLASEGEDGEVVSVDFAALFVIGGIMFVVVAILCLLCSFAIYRSERFGIANSNLNYEFTFIIKKRVALPLEKINIVKVKRNLLDMILGTSTVEIGSGNVASSLKAEVKLCLDKQFATVFADYLQRYSKAVKDNLEFDEDLEETLKQAPDVYETAFKPDTKTYNMTVADKLRYVVSNPAAYITALCMAVVVLVVVLIHAIAPDSFEGESFTEVLVGVTLGMSGMLLLSVIGVFLHAFLGYYDYKIERDNDGIRISFGLLSRRSLRVPMDKIHGYSISRGILRQMLGYGNLKLCVIGMDEGQGDNQGSSPNYLYPCGTYNSLKAFAETLLPEFKFEGEMTKAVTKPVSLVHTMVLPLVVTLAILLPYMLVLGALVHISIFIATTALLVLLIGGHGLLAWRYAAFGINANYVCCQSGGLYKTFSVIKTNSVQEISTYAGRFRRRQGLCTYMVVYRGSSMLTSRIFVRNVPETAIDDL